MVGHYPKIEMMQIKWGGPKWKMLQIQWDGGSIYYCGPFTVVWLSLVLKSNAMA